MHVIETCLSTSMFRHPWDPDLSNIRIFEVESWIWLEKPMRDVWFDKSTTRHRIFEYLILTESKCSSLLWRYRAAVVSYMKAPRASASQIVSRFSKPRVGQRLALDLWKFNWSRNCVAGRIKAARARTILRSEGTGSVHRHVIATGLKQGYNRGKGHIPIAGHLPR